MASKRQTTMAKMTRERAVREKREKKREKKRLKAEGLWPEPIDDAAPPEHDAALDEASPEESADESAESAGSSETPDGR